MASTFGGIELAKRTLQTQQKSLTVTGHNIANANTEGYSRQRAVQSATTPHAKPSLYNSTGAGQIGTGVHVKKVERARDQFIDSRIRAENHALGEWDMKHTNLKEIEAIFNDLDEAGMVNNLNQFWDSFQELNNNPESMAVRETVVQQTITLTTQMNHFDNSLMELHDNLSFEIEGRINEFNSLTSRIASLNDQIKAVESDSNKNANDLMDERDLLLDRLSELADVDIRIDDTNQANISLNGINVVQGKFAQELEVNNTSSKQEVEYGVDSEGNDIDFNHSYDIETSSFSIGGNNVQINSGEIKGLMDVQDSTIDYKQDLDMMAVHLAHEVNKAHESGFDLNGDEGVEFFVFEDDVHTAGQISINQDIIDDPALIAAASTADAGQGDGSNALKIANLKDKGDTIGGTTFNDFWQRQSSNLGIEIERADRMEGNQKVLVNDLKSKREEVSGVSLDEEMTEMVKFQHAYNAAGRVISRLDEMFNTLVNSI